MSYLLYALSNAQENLHELYAYTGEFKFCLLAGIALGIKLFLIIIIFILIFKSYKCMNKYLKENKPS